jgi:signal transduction histidine kinase
MLAASRLLVRWRVDDAVGAVPVHLGAGIWGTLAVALFGQPLLLATGLGFWDQLAIQVVGITTCGAWTFGIVYLISWVASRFFALRVGPAEEEIGINVSEHGATTTLLDLSHAVEIIIDDIAERRWLEQEREELIVDLEAKNEEIQRFTCAASHDLKSPLITIRSFADLLADDAGQPQRLDRDIRHIIGAADNMQRMLAELLELSRIGHVVNSPVTFSMVDLTHQAVDFLAGRILERGVEIQIAADLPEVRGDQPRILQVLQNLIDNAVKFMGGQEDPRVSIGFRQTDRAFFVRDNGIGIDPQHHSRVFDLFNRLDKNVDGTGLGLSLIKRIGEAHDGRIWVESSVDRTGSTFYFTLVEKSPSRGKQRRVRSDGERKMAS